MIKLLSKLKKNVGVISSCTLKSQNLLKQEDPDGMQVLVTEATSPVAYHLLPLLANGDVLQQQVSQTETLKECGMLGK